MIRVCLVLLEMAKLSSKVEVPFCISTCNYERSCFSTESPAFDVVGVLDIGHSDRCVMILCCFNLYFSDDTKWGAFAYFLHALNRCYYLSKFGNFLLYSGTTLSKLKKEKAVELDLMNYFSILWLLNASHQCYPHMSLASSMLIKLAFYISQKIRNKQIDPPQCCLRFPRTLSCLFIRTLLFSC